MLVDFDQLQANVKVLSMFKVGQAELWFGSLAVLNVFLNYNTFNLK